MTANGAALDDKVSKGGDTMSGPLNFQGNPPYTVMNSGPSAASGTVMLNGTTAVAVATNVVDADSVIQLTVQPGTAPVGQAWISSVTPGTGFSVKSTSSSDTAVVVGWSIVEGAAAP
jgi:hypothetical protein